MSFRTKDFRTDSIENAVQFALDQIERLKSKLEEEPVKLPIVWVCNKCGAGFTAMNFRHDCNCKPEIWPQPGELWTHKDSENDVCFIFSMHKNPLTYRWGIGNKDWNVGNGMKHGKNGWKRIYPPVEGE